MDKTSPMKSKPLVDCTCKLGTKGCFKDGRCHALGNCENKIVTNADRIRAMTDEELADSFMSKCLCDFIPYHTQDHCASYGSCKGCILEWLRQPAEK